MDETTPAVLMDVRDYIATLTLNRPERRNALSLEVLEALLAALAQADADPAVRAVVITGAGKAFCAGGDLSTMTEGDVISGHYRRQRYADLFRALVHFGKPTLAAINGAAIGGGVGLVCAADLALAADDVLLGTPETWMGLFPMMVSALLMRGVPRKIAVEMMYLGQRVSAARAAEIGLINAVVPRAEFAQQVAQWAAKLTQLSPTAVRLGKQAVLLQEALPLDQALTVQNTLFTLNANSPEAQEGIRAFFEKRPPAWLPGTGHGTDDVIE